MSLDTPIEYLKGVGPEKGALLKKELGIGTFEDLLMHIPFRYVDKSSIHHIGDLNERMPFCQVVGRIDSVKLIGKGGAKRFTAVLSDDTGSLELVWFKGIPWVQKTIHPGLEFLVFGKPNEFKGKLNIIHPELESVTNDKNVGGKVKMQPVYSTTEKLKTKNLDSKGISRLLANLFEKIGTTIPEVFRLIW